MLQLDLIQTLAFGGVALLAGYGLRRVFPVLARLNMPAAVLGGLLVSLFVWAARSRGFTLLGFDTTLQSPLMIAFFTTVGFGASLSLLRAGGRPFVIFLLLASVFAVLQNVLGVGVALAFGLHPLFGVLTGSVALTGGPGTAASFAPLFEQAGVAAAAPVGIATAMAGIAMGALIGGPVVTWLIHRHRLQGPGIGAAAPRAALVEEGAEAQAVLSGGGAEDDEEVFPLLKSVIALLIAMWLGSYVSKGFALLDITLPPYIGAMMVAAVIRNLDDAFGWFGLSHRVLDSIGAIALSLFLSMALMNLRLWEITGLALPLLVGLLLQVVMVIGAAAFVFRRMGRDYEAAVMSGGFIGFMLGTTANAMAGDARAGGALWRRAARFPDCAAGRGVLHRLRQRLRRHGLHQHLQVNTPLLIAHRGASGYLPEHTLPAYALAILQGADYIEPDLVATRDGVLVARHENEIGGTTDVAGHPEFAERRRVQNIDGVDIDGWFTEDFTLAELKTLRARERIPLLRPGNVQYDGRFEVPAFDEILAYLAEVNVVRSQGGLAPVGVYPETKHPTHFAAIGLPLEALLLAALGKGLGNAPVFIQSFETGNLQQLRRQYSYPLVQLMSVEGGPWDQRTAGKSSEYSVMIERAGLAQIAGYASAIGVQKEMVMRHAKGGMVATPLIDAAHAAGLAVHAWTFRAENQFLPVALRHGDDASSHGDMLAEIRAYAAAGVDGVFCDHPRLARLALAQRGN